MGPQVDSDYVDTLISLPLLGPQGGRCHASTVPTYGPQRGHPLCSHFDFLPPLGPKDGNGFVEILPTHGPQYATGDVSILIPPAPWAPENCRGDVATFISFALWQPRHCSGHLSTLQCCPHVPSHDGVGDVATLFLPGRTAVNSGHGFYSHLFFPCVGDHRGRRVHPATLPRPQRPWQQGLCKHFAHMLAPKMPCIGYCFSLSPSPGCLQRGVQDGEDNVAPLPTCAPLYVT